MTPLEAFLLILATLILILIFTPWGKDGSW